MGFLAKLKGVKERVKLLSTASREDVLESLVQGYGLGKSPKVRKIMTDRIRGAMHKRAKKLFKKGKLVTVDVLASVPAETPRFMEMLERQFHITRNEIRNIARAVVKEFRKGRGDGDN